MFRDRNSDPLCRGIDLLAVGVGVTKRHGHLLMTEKPGHDGQGDTLHESLTGVRVTTIMKPDILDPGFPANQMPKRQVGPFEWQQGPFLPHRAHPRGSTILHLRSASRYAAH